MTWRQSQVQLQDRKLHMIIDDRFAKAAPVKELPCLNWFGVWFVGPTTEDVFVPPAEEQTFLALERRLIEVAGTLANGWAVYWLRLLSRGIVEYYLYSRDASTLSGVITEMKREYPKYKLEHETRDDAAWSEYSKYLRALQ